MSLAPRSHRRLNLLSGEWVLVSPQRLQRPWQGQVESVEAPPLAKFSQECYLCPGNTRANGSRNPDYHGPFAFDNDFPALTPGAYSASGNSELLVSRPESGVCRVICYCERHDLNLAGMDHLAATNALRFVSEEWRRLDRQPDIAYVQVFENRGTMMGCSNAHPHAQIWATSRLPNEPSKELAAQRAYFEAHARPLLLAYLEEELNATVRVVYQNRSIVVLVPYWAIWPYETLLVPRREVAALDDLQAHEFQDLADALQVTLRTYDRLFQTTTPYSMGFHARPSNDGDHPEWQLHAHIYPPLLRSASVRKHMVGFEMLGMPQRDLTPEAAAAALRDHIASSSQRIVVPHQ